VSKVNADLLCYTLSFSLAACFCGGMTKNNAFNQSLQLCKLKNDNNSHHVTPTSTNLTVLLLVAKSKGEVKEDLGYHPPSSSPVDHHHHHHLVYSEHSGTSGSVL
jgi:hypothetical protein